MRTIRHRSEREFDCLPMSKRALLILGLLVTPALASAQTSTTVMSSPYEQRGFVQFGGGAQSGSHTLASSSTFTIYDEQGTIDGTQEYGGGAIWNLGGGVRVWKNLVAALNYTHNSDSMDASVVARVPHPLFANRPREATQTVEDLKHSENAYHFAAMWMFPLNEDLTLGVGGGPSFVSVAHEFATSAGVQETGTPPDFATVALTDVTFTRGRKTGTTINIGADLNYNLPFDLGQYGRVGATLGFRYAGGDVTVANSTRNVDVKYGGAQFWGGLRVSF
jgi:hypothetical protein